jgi:hypothetical protein
MIVIDEIDTDDFPVELGPCVAVITPLGFGTWPTSMSRRVYDDHARSGNRASSLRRATVGLSKASALRGTATGFSRSGCGPGCTGGDEVRKDLGCEVRRWVGVTDGGVDDDRPPGCRGRP